VLECTNKVNIANFKFIAFYSHYGQPETYGLPGQDNNFAPLQTYIL
jgi:hypothetical protein